MHVIVFLEADDGELTERQTAAHEGQFLRYRYKFFCCKTCILNVNKVLEVLPPIASNLRNAPAYYRILE